MAKGKKVKAPQQDSFFVRSIRRIEAAGNRIPHPFFMFLYLSLFICVLSAIFSAFDVSVQHMATDSATGELVATTTHVQNLLSVENLQRVLTNFVSTYIGFAPLGLIMVMMLSIGYAQATGLFDAALRKLLLGAPRYLVTFVICLVAVCANIASNAGTVLAATIGGAIFASLGRNPILGAICGYATCQGAWSANLLVAGTDVILAGITDSVASGMGIEAPTHAMMNYFFMFAATFVVAITSTILTEKVMPKVITIGRVTPNADATSAERVTPTQARGLKFAAVATAIYVAILLVMTVPSNGILRGEDGSLIPQSPFISSIVGLMFLLFFIAGTAYGYGAGVITKKTQIPAMMGEGIASSLSFYVIALPASFFINLFTYSRIGTILAVWGGEFLQRMNFTGLPLLICFVFLCCIINLFMDGASEKWMILAPVFIPMFAMMDFSPALTQLAYRIGDSVANPIAPVNTAIPLLLAIIAKYRKEDDPEYGIGTVISLALPYSLSFLVVLTLLLVVFVVFQLPIGPGIEQFLR